MSTRPFHIGDILSVTTGCLVSPRHVDGIYDLLNIERHERDEWFRRDGQLVNDPHGKEQR